MSRRKLVEYAETTSARLNSRPTAAAARNGPSLSVARGNPALDRLRTHAAKVRCSGHDDRSDRGARSLRSAPRDEPRRGPSLPRQAIRRPFIAIHGIAATAPRSREQGQSREHCRVELRPQSGSAWQARAALSHVWRLPPSESVANGMSTAARQSSSSWCQRQVDTMATNSRNRCAKCANRSMRPRRLGMSGRRRDKRENGMTFVWAHGDTH